jgi:hypothetical protein
MPIHSILPADLNEFDVIVSIPPSILTVIISRNMLTTTLRSQAAA